MASITPVVSSLLVSTHSSVSIKKHVHSPDRLDTFLQEAYRINAHISSLLQYLRQIRQPYLSTSAPPPSRHNPALNRQTSSSSSSVYLTDPQRAEIDTQTSTLLHDLSSNISSLTAAENLRSSTETALLEKRFGKGDQNSLLWRWAAGDKNDADDEALGKSTEQLEAEGRVKAIKAFREGVLWYLGYKLQGVVDVQRSMVEVRATREREKEKSVLWKMKTGASAESSAVAGGGQIPRRTGANSELLGTKGDVNHEINGGYNPTLEEENRRRTASNVIDPDDLPPHLLHLLEEENSSLLQHYNTTLSKIQQAETSLLEISSLQSTLLTHLGAQGEMIEHLVQDAQGTDENVRKGNRELKRAGERWGRGLARGIFWATVGLCGFLVGWDLVF